jgi:hypothetical protein
MDRHCEIAKLHAGAFLEGDCARADDRAGDGQGIHSLGSVGGPVDTWPHALLWTSPHHDANRVSRSGVVPRGRLYTHAMQVLTGLGIHRPVDTLCDA